MTTKATLPVKSTDDMLKAMLVFARTATHVLEARAVEAAVGEALSSSKVQILRLLGHQDGQTSTQIARFLGVSKPAVSQLIESMVRSKLVSRKTAAADRREVNLRLTKRGMSLFHSIRQQQRHYIRGSARRVSKANAARWTSTLFECSQALGQADEAYQYFCAQCRGHEDGTCVLVGGDAECIYMQHRPRAAREEKTATKRR